MQNKTTLDVFLTRNLKHLRKQQSLTQEDFAQKLSLKKSTYASYEATGGNTPPSHTLYLIAKILGVPLQSLFEIDYTLLGNQQPIKISNKETYFPVSVDTSGTELIDIVPSTYQAQAGYLSEFSNPSFIESLPKVRWDFGTYMPGTKRLFQIVGDSMLPIPSQSYILTVRNSFDELIQDHPYIIITQDDILFKRIQFDGDRLTLNSDNPLYPTQHVQIDDVVQYWRGIKMISDLPEKSAASLDQLNQTIQDTNEKVTTLLMDFKKNRQIK